MHGKSSVPKIQNRITSRSRIGCTQVPHNKYGNQKSTPSRQMLTLTVNKPSERKWKLRLPPGYDSDICKRFVDMKVTGASYSLDIFIFYATPCVISFKIQFETKINCTSTIYWKEKIVMACSQIS